MRHEASGTCLSWIPSENVTGVNKVAFGVGFTHYDDPPPSTIDDLDALLAADAFRFGNVVAGWIEVDDAGAIVDHGHSGRTLMGATTIRIGRKEATFDAVEFPPLRDTEVGDGWVRFTQTTGGHTAVPAPRHVKGGRLFALEAPTVWSTLALTLHADGRSELELTGASAFPRHWVYDADGALVAKAGLADFATWWTTSFGANAPWSGVDGPVLVTEAESALERELSHLIMRGGEKPQIRNLQEGELLTRQGDPGDEVFLLLNGVLDVDVDGAVLAQLGPGAIVGERAAVEGGTRTSSLRAVTRAKVAVARPDQIDSDALAELSEGHRREDGPGDEPR